MSDKRNFYFLEDGQTYPPAQSGAETALSAFCKGQIGEARATVTEALEALKYAADHAAKQLAGCQTGFFVGTAEKEEAYDILCRFFLEIEDSKNRLSDEAIRLTHVAEELFDEIRLTGEQNTEKTRMAQTAATLCDRLIFFCTKTLEQLCTAIDGAADTEHECQGVRIGDTQQICASFREILTDFQAAIQEDRLL